MTEQEPHGKPIPGLKFVGLSDDLATRDGTHETPLLGVAYPATPDDQCPLCEAFYDEEGRCLCDDEPWYDEDQGHDDPS